MTELVGFDRPKLAVPEHVAIERARTAELKVNRLPTWDEDGLTIADLPQTTGWRIMIEPIEVKNITKGGIILSDLSTEAQEYMRYVGKVVNMGPLCYQHRKFEGGEPWCKVGDWVVHGRYAGQEAQIKGDKEVHSFRFVNDDEILATTERPEKLIMYAGIY